MLIRKGYILLLTVLAASLFISCKHKPICHLSFYHWSVENSNDMQVAHQDSILTHFRVHKYYVKIMDIDWDAIYGVHPSTSFSVNNILAYSEHKLSDSFEIIPVIFITTKALEKTDAGSIYELANKIVLKTNQLVQGKKTYDSGLEKTVIDTTIKYTEIQLDCDWTKSIQSKYFSLLTCIKKIAPHKLITSTLRLHQYKYPEKTGIPPVDELYLMCYNTGDVKNADESNSIFNYEKTKQYFTRVSAYPKKLNFALPLFDWVVIFKNNSFYKIDNAIDYHFFLDTSTVKHTINNNYQLLKDTVINNVFLRSGDILRRETISNEDLVHSAELCAKAINSKEFKVVFYNIDHVNPGNYEAVQKAFSCFYN